MLLLFLFVAATCLLLNLQAHDAYTTASPPPRLHVVTVVTDPMHPKLQLLKNTAKKHGLDIHVMVSPKPFGHAVAAFGVKQLMFYDLLKSGTLPADDIVMLVDGYDLIINASEAELLRRFHRFRHDIVFAAELFCSPDQHRDKDYASRKPHVAPPYRYLNCGAFMGKVSALKQLYDDYSDRMSEEMDDQRVMTSIYLETNRIVLDARCSIFWCLVGADGHAELTDRGWKNTETQTYPAVFHANGPLVVKDVLFEKMYPHM